jgi:hypothetical protein
MRIFDAAIGLFIEHGYKRTTLIDIAAEADVSTRTLYRYFPTKESILQQFANENLLELKEFALTLPQDQALSERVLETMVHDYVSMFRRFDVTCIIDSSRDESGNIVHYEIENVVLAESIYYTMFKREQKKYGISANENTKICSTLVMGIYRHCSDLYRFYEIGPFNLNKLKIFFKTCLDTIWDSIEAALLSKESVYCPPSLQPEKNPLHDKLIANSD